MAGSPKQISGAVSPELERQAIAWRRHLHANPELSYEETETSAFVEHTLRALDGLDIERPTPTSVVARLRGSKPGKVLALRADMDALPVQEETGLPFASSRVGIMHACGHDAHTAILLAAASALVDRRDGFCGEVRFLFQHAEEMLPGGARQLIDAGALDGVDLIVGLHLWAQEDVGIVSVPAEPCRAATDFFALTIQGAAGHAALPHTAIDPIAVATEVVANFQHVVARTVDPLKSAVVSVTKFHAGTANNVIPDVAELSGTVRAFDKDVQASVRARLERIVRGVTDAHGATYRLDYVEGHPPLRNNPAAAALVEQAARTELGDVIQPTAPIMGGEDFSVYLEKVPGAYFIVGAGGADRPPHHHPCFTIDEAAIRPGIAVFVRTALDFLAA